jgi:biopolymer transport protein ExbD
MRRAAVVLVAVMACKAGSGQSFHDGVQAWCDLPDHVPDTGDSPEQRLTGVAKWAEANITNSDAKAIGAVTNLEANKQALTDAVKKAGVASCKLLDHGMALQSFADAMKVVCATPAQPAGDGAHKPDPSAYLRSHLLNPEVIRMVGKLGDLNPADEVTVLRDAMSRAGLASCAIVDAAGKQQAKQAPKVHGGGFVEVGQGPTVTATTGGIIADGKAIVPIKNNAVEVSELDGGVFGLRIPRLIQVMKAIAAARGPGPVNLVVDPALTYNTLMQLLVSARAAGFAQFAFVVDVADQAKAIPIALPDLPKAQKLDNKPAPWVMMVVTIDKDKLLLWSISGKEGTLQQPKLVAHSADEIGTALARIVEERWHGGSRADDDRSIIVMANSSTPMQTVADVLAAVRAGPDGKELFPNIMLSAGL